jgi:hypothetical protein
MTLQITEILARSTQGRTQPYICRCDDDEVYFVKGRTATRQGLINEWLCGHLAQALALPIAPFAIAHVPDELIEADLSGWLGDLGPGAVFASRKVLGQELATAQVFDIKEALRRDVLVFDWWVRNGDRCLTARGGNVNLLWQPLVSARNEDDERMATGQLAVIDHNLALDKDFSPTDFCQTHVFAADLADTFSDFVLREQYKTRLSQALARLDDAWNNLPATWHFVDSEQTLPTDYPKADVWAMLERIESPTFWNLPA